MASIDAHVRCSRDSVHMRVNSHRRVLPSPFATIPKLTFRIHFFVPISQKLTKLRGEGRKRKKASSPCIIRGRRIEDTFFYCLNFKL